MKKFLKRINAKQAGFTLIELLVVIAIIGILAAIIVPNVSKYISGGSQAAADSELKIIQNAVAAAMADARVGVLYDNNTEPKPQSNGTTPNFGGTNGDMTITGSSKAAKVSDYLTDGMTGVKGTYSINSNGAVKRVTSGQ